MDGVEKQKVKISLLSEMTEKAASGVRPAVLSDFDELARRVNSGWYQLYEINDGESYLITETINYAGSDKRLFVWCYAGKNIREMFQIIENAARRSGYSAIEYQTHRPGMRKMAEINGYNELVRIYRKSL